METRSYARPKQRAVPVRSYLPVRGNGIQKFSAISKPGDIWEREADHAARFVTVGKPAAGFSPAKSNDLPAVPPVVSDALRSPGQPLDPATRAFIEPRFGHDFSHVRVHADETAAESARAVSALAYTVGNHIVFGAGQHEPGNSRGQRLLAHELIHVVQQDGGQTFAGARSVQSRISPAPAGLVSRKASLEDQNKQKEAVKKHETQQRNIAGFLDAVRKIRPDPKKGLRDPDSLFHNTVEMLDAGRFTLTILSPTHYSPDRHFDDRYKYPKIGGDYQADPTVGSPGMVLEASPPAGKIFIPPPSPTFQPRTLPEKTERTPGAPAPKPGKTERTPAKVTGPLPAPVPFLPSDIYLFTRGLDIDAGDFRNTFVHEAQHVADLSPKRAYASSADELLESYKSEFRGFWIQPSAPGGPPGRQAIDRLPEPVGKADNSKKVTIADPERCTVCPAPPASGTPGKKTISESTTGMKNPRQNEIFLHILSEYKTQQYDCCYVHDQKFRTAVNEFAFPESVNLINSERLMSLNLGLQKLRPTMTKDEAAKTDFSVALQNLDALDWAFLKNETVSMPFWKALKTNAPDFLNVQVKALAKKAKTSP